LRYFTEPVWFWVELIQPFGKYASIAMIIGLGGLWARRFLVDRIRYISNLSDHLMLALLLTIAISGALMTFFVHTDIVSLKSFVMGMMYFDFQALPSSILLLLHLAMVMVLLVIFPVSKLLHAPGLFFAPTRNQVDNPREQRHVQGWTAK
jgi:nitrate reductase gamma subunit